MPRKSALTRVALEFHSRSSQRSPILSTLALTFFACVLGAGIALGQATTSVRGTVTDPAGGAIVGANVVLANAELKTERTATTGEQGEYQFLLISPGTYTLKVTAAGFRTHVRAVLSCCGNMRHTDED